MRAPATVIMDGPLFDLARRYVGQRLKVVAGLVTDDRSGLLVAGDDAFVVVPTFVDGVGNYSVAFNQVWDPLHCPAGASKAKWMILLDAQSSEVHLVPLNDLYWNVSTNNNGQGGLAIDGANPNAIVVRFNTAWARTNGLIVKSLPLGKGDDAFDFFRKSELRVPERFVNLHVHSMYSLLDGASTIEGIARAAYFNGQPGIALTDHGNMFGSWKFYKECKEWGIKPVFGMEAYLVDDVNARYKDRQGTERRFEYHVTLLAMNRQGLENLFELATISGRDHFWYVPRMDHATLLSHSDGLIVLSGSFKGVAAWHCADFDPAVTYEVPWYRKDLDRARWFLRTYKGHLRDRFLGEVQPLSIPRYMQALPTLMQLMEEEGVPMVPTVDAHYEVPEDAYIQRIVSRINSTKVDEIGDGDAPERTGPYFIKQRSEVVHPLFTDPMFERTCEVLDRCSVEFDESFLFPRYRHEQDADWLDFVMNHKEAGAK